MTPLLDITGLSARYGHIEALREVALRVGAGELVAVLGPNGAGKSTLLRAIMGLVEARGTIAFEGRPIERSSTRQRAAGGMIMVPEGRGIFAPMTVDENLELGAYAGRDAQTLDRRRREIFELFPRLRQRLDQVAGSLSGGEQQMLAIGRALMAAPRLLMLDEPSLGLAPKVSAEILQTLGALNKAGLGILLVEQKAPLALRLASRAYILSVGRVAAEVKPGEIRSAKDLSRYYLAEAHDAA